jgi:hypothetical protein
MVRTGKRTAGIVLILGLGVVLSACSGEDIAEKAIEQQLEAEGDGDVDVDIDEDGGISIQGPDGSTVINVDEDGGNIEIGGEDGANMVIEGTGDDAEIRIEGSDGETFISNTQLPDNFPSNVPLPDGLDVQLGQTSSSPDGDIYLVAGISTTDFSDLTDQYIDQLEGAGFAQQALTNTPEGSFFTYGDADYILSGSIGPDSMDSSQTAFNLTVVPATS